MIAMGIDVAKESLVCAFLNKEHTFPNSVSGFKQILKWGGDNVELWCMEATGRYHEAFAQFLYDHDLPCRVVNPAMARQYGRAMGGRAKTDKVDALALARLGTAEGQHLRPFEPVPQAIKNARDLISQREALVDCRVKLKLCMGSTVHSAELERSIAALETEIRSITKRIEKELGDYPKFKVLQTIPGIGPLSAALLVCALERGTFAHSDSLVAYAGLDPRASDSGKHRGRRQLSHQGDSQLRKVMFMAARSGVQQGTWKKYYESQRAKGLPTTAAYVIVARKLLRVAWSIYDRGTPFTKENPRSLDKQP